MKYRGKTIKEPTLKMFIEHITRRHLAADPVYVYEYYKQRNWKTRKGKTASSVESMIGGLNNYFLKGKTTPKLGQPLPPFIDTRPSYDAQLQDPKWKAFREFVFVVRGKKCEKCGATAHLQVHHPKYRNGRLAWEYTCREVVVLCSSCHQKVHNIKPPTQEDWKKLEKELTMN